MVTSLKLIGLGLLACCFLTHCRSGASREDAFRQAIMAEETLSQADDKAQGETDRLLTQIRHYLAQQEEAHAISLIQELIDRYPSIEVQQIGEAWKEELEATQEKRLADKLAAFANAVSQRPPPPLNPLVNPIAEIKQQLDEKQDVAAMASIGQVVEMLASDPVQQAGEALTTEIRKQRQERIDLLQGKVEQVELRLGPLLLTCEAPDDFKAIALEVRGLEGEMKHESAISGDTADSFQTEFAALDQIVNDWQMFLYALSAQRMKEAHDRRAALTKNLAAYQEVPVTMADVAHHADELLNDPKFLGDTPPTCQGILVRVRSLDQLEAAQAQFDLLRAWKPELVPQEDYIYLAFLIRTYREVKWQHALDLEMLTSEYTPQAPDFLRIRDMLYLDVLPLCFEVSGPEAPAPGETADGYLDRLTQSSLAAHNWTLLKKIAEARKQLDSYQALLDSNSLDYLISAENQEAGGQYVLEVMSYCHALISSSKLVPAKYIGAKLDRLKREHPKEYAEATGLQSETPAP